MQSKCQSGISVGLEDFSDGIDVGSCTQIQPLIVVHSGVHDGPCCPLHGVIKSRVDNVLLRSSRHSALKLCRGCDINGASNTAKAAFKGVLDWLQQVIVGLTLILEGEAAIRDMVKVLEPLKVGDGDTPCIDVHIRDDETTIVTQNLQEVGMLDA